MTCWKVASQGFNLKIFDVKVSGRFAILNCYYSNYFLIENRCLN